MRYLFVGPSLPDVCDHLDGLEVEVMPPIAAGDLLRLHLRDGDVVGIVDGYFHQAAAVRHKEIFAALADGVRVLGASSMGALRAAELDRYGMEGVGHVYAEYRSGRIIGDDEVALLHGPPDAGYPAFSQPLVNLRSTLAAAVESSVLGEDLRGELIDLLVAMPYRQRTHRVLAKLAVGLGVPHNQAKEIAAYCHAHAVDHKRGDALLLVRRMADVPDRPAPRPVLNRTVYLHNWEQGARGGRIEKGGPWVSDASRIRVCQLFARDYEEFHRDLVFKLIAEECARDCDTDTGQQPPHEAAIRHGGHRGYYPERLDEREFGFLAEWTTAAERLMRSPGEVLPLFIVRAYRIWPGVAPRAAAAEALARSEAFERAGRVVRAAMDLEAKVRAANYDSSRLPPGRVVRWFAARWGVCAEDMEFAALDRGMESMEAFFETARPYYLLAKHDPDLVDGFAVRRGRAAL